MDFQSPCIPSHMFNAGVGSVDALLGIDQFVVDDGKLVNLRAQVFVFWGVWVLVVQSGVESLHSLEQRLWRRVSRGTRRHVSRSIRHALEGQQGSDGEARDSSAHERPAGACTQSVPLDPVM